LSGANLEVPPGAYAIRIAGRGFVNFGWPGSTEPGDQWRIQLWPHQQTITPKQLRAWPGPEDD
jgi:hypothetical protein